MRLLAMALAFACSGCNASPTGADGYYFENPEFERRRVVVEFVPVSSDLELKKIGELHHISFTRDTLKDLTLLTKGGCIIYVADPTTRYEPEWMGHALTHCLFGQFHLKQNAERK